jgi:hypothetical protein
MVQTTNRPAVRTNAMPASAKVPSSGRHHLWRALRASWWNGVPGGAGICRRSGGRMLYGTEP